MPKFTGILFHNTNKTLLTCLCYVSDILEKFGVLLTDTVKDGLHENDKL